MVRGVLDWIRAATMAPSVHNTQPWRFAFGPEYAYIFADYTRALRIADPAHRELYLSLGCALENLIVAARSDGSQADVEVFPADEALASVRVIFSAVEAEASPLAAAIPQRRTNHRVYDRRPLAPEVVRELEALRSEPGTGIRLLADHGQFSPYGAFVALADEVLFSNPAYRQELLTWMRFTPEAARRTRDGLFAPALGLPAVSGWLSHLAFHAALNPKRIATRDEALVDSASALVVIYSADDDRRAWIAAGRTLERLLLTATSLGLQHAYLNQTCQVPHLREQLVVRLPSDARFPQAVLRLGYAEPVPRSLRRPLEDVLVPHAPPERRVYPEVPSVETAAPL